MASSTTLVGGRPDEEDVGGRPLGQVAVDRQEERVVGAGPARLEPGVDVVGAGRGLERRERVGRVAPDRPRRRGGGRARGGRPAAATTGQAWIAIVARDDLVGRQQTAAAERAARDRDPDRGVAGRPVEPLGREQVGDPDRQASPRGRPGSAIVEAGRRARAAGRCARPARSGGRRARGASRRRRRPAGSRDRRPRGAAPSAGSSRPSTQTWPGVAGCGAERAAALTRPPRRRWRRADRAPWRRSRPTRRPGRSSR